MQGRAFTRQPYSSTTGDPASNTRESFDGLSRERAGTLWVALWALARIVEPVVRRRNEWKGGVTGRTLMRA